MVRKKTFKFRKNLVGVKVVRLGDEEPILNEVTVVCARRKKRVKGILTCGDQGIDAAIKRLIRFQLID